MRILQEINDDGGGSVRNQRRALVRPHRNPNVDSPANELPHERSPDLARAADHENLHRLRFLGIFASCR